MRLAHARRSADPLTSMFMRVSLPAIERLQRVVTRSRARSWRAANRHSHLQQLRAQDQARFVNRGHVDLEANLVGVDDELNHSTATREVRKVADGERGGLPKRREDAIELAVFRGADEQHAAAAG